MCNISTPNIPAGQMATGTFAAYVALNQYVGRITQKIRNTSYVRCLDAAWKEISC